MCPAVAYHQSCIFVSVSDGEPQPSSSLHHSTTRHLNRFSISANNKILRSIQSRSSGRGTYDTGPLQFLGNRGAKISVQFLVIVVIEIQQFLTVN